MACALALLLGAACSHPAAAPTGASTPPGANAAPGAPASTPPEAGADLAAAVRERIGDAACSDDAQCRTLGWGARACGGPSHWLAWSTLRSDAPSLQALAAREAQRERAAAQRLGMASTCQVAPDPGAQCVAQRCVLRPAPRAH
jgi:hypothetical protein